MSNFRWERSWCWGRLSERFRPGRDKRWKLVLFPPMVLGKKLSQSVSSITFWWCEGQTISFAGSKRSHNCSGFWYSYTRVYTSCRRMGMFYADWRRPSWRNRWVSECLRPSFDLVDHRSLACLKTNAIAPSSDQLGVHWSCCLHMVD